MINLDSLLARIFLRNGGFLIIPPMIITFGLWGKLPEAFSAEVFWKDIPKWLGLLENAFRVLVFSVPFILFFGSRDNFQSAGWYVYGIGIFIYLLSYLAQVFLPNSPWSTSFIGFTAPAWTCLFWFTGIGMVCMHSWLSIRWHWAVYVGLSAAFLVFHIGHTALIYARLKG